MNVITDVYDSLKWKKKDEICAQRLNMDLDLYRKLKEQVLNIRSAFQNDVDDILKESIQKRLTDLATEEDIRNHIVSLEEKLGKGFSDLQNKIIEFKENVAAGTGEIKAICQTEPQSPEEVERVVKIHGSPKWKLSSYWNKQQPNGMWIISAQVASKKDNELSLGDVEEILTSVFSPKKFPSMEHYPKLSNQRALFVYTSDKHIAAYVNDQRALYKNEYNEFTYESRMKQVLHEVLYLKSIFGHFEDIYIIDLGDKMDGWDSLTTRKNHKLPQNMSNREAFETAIKVEKEFYDLIIQANVANTYHTILNTCSNHGGDFEYIVNRSLEEYINLAYPFVSTHIQQTFIEHITYGKHVLLFTHGKDDEDMKFGLPLHLNEKTENFLNKYLMKNKIDVEHSHVSVVKGDLHINNSQDAYGFRYRNVLSLFGMSKWIGHNFGPNKPGCSFDIIERDTQRVYEHRILFSH